MQQAQRVDTISTIAKKCLDGAEIRTYLPCAGRLLASDGDFRRHMQLSPMIFGGMSSRTSVEIYLIGHLLPNGVRSHILIPQAHRPHRLQIRNLSKIRLGMSRADLWLLDARRSRHTKPITPSLPFSPVAHACGIPMSVTEYTLPKAFE